jgi:hypothetical protein
MFPTTAKTSATQPEMAVFGYACNYKNILLMTQTQVVEGVKNDVHTMFRTPCATKQYAAT